MKRKTEWGKTGRAKPEVMKQAVQGAAASEMDVFLLAAFSSLFLTGCYHVKEQPPFPSAADLVICTDLETAVYEPVVKEFEERTGLSVEVLAGTAGETRQRFLDARKQEEVAAQEQREERASNADAEGAWDLAFGVSAELLEEYRELWLSYESTQLEELDARYSSKEHAWTGFSVLPLVIMYNTNVVTYRELPVGWESLLEPRWQGHVAFAAPEQSDMSAAALAAALLACPDRPDYLKALVENLNGMVSDSDAQVNEGILDGRDSVGVTTEAAAQTLRSSGADIDYIYPEEGTLLVVDGTAIRAGNSHPDAAQAFLEFTVSRDTQKILLSSQNRRPVRRDIAMEKGMAPLERLPLLEADEESCLEKKREALSEWEKLRGGAS